MGILHPREQNFHPAKCSTIFNRLNIWEQAPGANWANLKTIPRVYWHVQNELGGKESNKKSVLSFMTSWKVCTTPPKGIDFFFQSLKRERGRGEERAPISPPPLPLPGRIRCSGYEVKKICPARFVSFPAAVSITHQPLGGRGVYSLKLLSVGKQLLFSPHLFRKVTVCHTAFLLHKIMLELCRKVEDTCQRASSLTVYVLKLYAPLFCLLLPAELRHDKIKPARNKRRRDDT